jgi:ABC-2 type transport system ATP-binding protein
VSPAPAAPAIRLRALRKEFGGVVAVDGIDLDVPEGVVYGYLGPNGAGKTTSLRMMLGLVRPTSGTVELFGRSPAADGVDALDGVAGFVESPTFYPYLSGRRNLHLLADLDGGRHHERVEEVLEVVELSGRGDDKVGGYSQGMRQRLGLAAALLRRPRLLLLDEPTNGLDPGGMRDMRRLVAALAADGLTVLLSTHLMVEVEQLCSELAVIARGRIRFAGTLADLQEAHRGADYRLSVTDVRRALATGADVPGVGLEAEPDTGQLLVRAEPGAAARLTVRLGEAGVGIYAMLPAAPSLEELFFGLTEAGPGADGVGGVGG